MPLELELFLALHVGVIARDEAATRLVLRRVATELEDRRALKLVQIATKTVDPREKMWLSSLY